MYTSLTERIAAAAIRKEQLVRLIAAAEQAYAESDLCDARSTLDLIHMLKDDAALQASLAKLEYKEVA